MNLSPQQIENLSQHQPEMLHAWTLPPLSAIQVMELSRSPELIALVGYEQGNTHLNVEDHFSPLAFGQQPIAALTVSQVEALTVH
ncbi:MAG: hypothetical protein WCF85_13865 [Rhodospirillaceae bacterium]